MFCKIEKSEKLLKETMNSDEICKMLEKYYKLKIEEIVDLKDEFEDALLEFLFETLYNTKCRFWYDDNGELFDFIKKENFNDKIMYNEIYNNEVDKLYVEIVNNYDERKVKKDANNLYMKKFFEKYYSMIDIERFLNTIQVHSISFEGDGIIIEFSSGICKQDRVFSHVVMEIDGGNGVYFNI